MRYTEKKVCTKNVHVKELWPLKGKKGHFLLVVLLIASTVVIKLTMCTYNGLKISV